GIKEGIKENQLLTAKNMKNKNMEINLISELTGLSIEEIEKL
ncbi:ATPase, partial [Brachyspira hampsonii]|nr:ATPase [Brachyspira hampsonii]